MPLDGAVVLTDLADKKLRLVCQRCALRRQYDVAQLMGKVGNAKLPGLISEIARRNGCEKVDSISLYDGCGAQMAKASSAEWRSGTGSHPADDYRSV